jgi:hypothetical protein
MQRHAHSGTLCGAHGMWFFSIHPAAHACTVTEIRTPKDVRTIAIIFNTGVNHVPNGWQVIGQ